MENLKKNKEYYIGYDIGTTSIGYAVTDTGYKVKKLAGKRAIGVMLFDEASTSAGRRVLRATRRRLARRVYRLNKLAEIFAPELNKVDPDFLQALKESDLKLEDRTNKGRKYSLFNDTNFTEKDYNKKYPTIYHLRQAVLEGKVSDIRLIFLAIHHILKKRGHFLTEGDFAKSTSIEFVINALNVAIDTRKTAIVSRQDDGELVSTIAEIDTKSICDLERHLLSKESKRDKKLKLVECLTDAKNKSSAHMLDNLLGGKVNFVTLFGKDAYVAEDLATTSFYLSDDFEEKRASLTTDLTEEDFNVICKMKAVYDWCVLKRLLKDSSNISSAMVAQYDKHKEDLKMLKDLIKRCGTEADYNDIFDKDVTKDGMLNYSAYVGRYSEPKDKSGKKTEAVPKKNQDIFYDYLKKRLAKITNIADDSDYIYVLSEIENKTFLPKQSSSANAVLPYQLNKVELEKMLDVVSKQHSFLLDADAEGYVAKDKLVKLLTFRIPYYVGPLATILRGQDDSNRTHAWAVAKEAGKIEPWNFDKKIDKESSEQAFIERMSSNCTYLKTAKALPKNSIIYSKFTALNELNKIKIDGESLSVEQKQRIYEDCYINRGLKTIKAKHIKESLAVYGINKDANVSGFNDTLKGNMSSYCALKKVIGDKVDTEPEMAEDLIFIMTIHESSAMRESAIRRKYGSQGNGKLQEEDVRQLKGIVYNGWGNISKEFLVGSTCGGLQLTDSKGEMHDILELLYDTNLCLMEILNDPAYDYELALQEYLQAHKAVEKEEIGYEYVQQLYCSPSVKRSVWQAFLATKEIVKLNKALPKKVFIEATRENDPSKKGVQTVARKKQIEILYNEAEKQKNAHLTELIHALRPKLEQFAEQGKLNSTKYYLYFLQFGQCAYSNQAIDLDRMAEYDIDHIIPRSIRKDDSLENKVLVFHTYNREKEASYPLDKNLRDANKIKWDMWHKAKTLSAEKYGRLCRVSELTEKEIGDFINRQLVETSQSVLLVKDMLALWFKNKLEERYPNDLETQNKNKVEIVLSKAGNISDFRKQKQLTKSREVNDFHHACDAYLNIVVGNVLNEKFNHNISFKKEKSIAIDKNEDGGKESLKFMETFDHDVKSYRTKGLVWKARNYPDSTITLVRKELNNHNFTMARKIKENGGQLYKETLFSAGSSKDLYPMVETGAKSDTSKYGGYKTSGTAYFVVVDSLQKGNKYARSLEAVPVFYDKKIKAGKMSMEQYLCDVVGLKSPKLSAIDGLPNSKLCVGSLLDFDGCRLRLAGKTGVQLTFHNANQLFVDKDTNDYIKEITNLLDKVNKKVAFMNVKKEDEKIQAKQQIFDDLVKKNIERTENKQNKGKNIVIITAESNLRIYDLFVEKINKPPYITIPGYGSIAKVLNVSRECFASYQTYMQSEILMKIIKAFQCNAILVDLSLLKGVDQNSPEQVMIVGKSAHGSIKASKFVNKNVLYIRQSITGLREQKIVINEGK